MSIRAEYERRRAQSLAEDKRLDGWSALYGNGRVLLVVVFGVAALRAWNGEHPQPWNLHLGLFGLLVLTLILQGIVDRRRAGHRRRAGLYERWLARLEGRWTTFASNGDHLATREHPYARDLDIVGRGSLFQLVDATRTAQGESTLARWLLAPSSVKEVETRKGTVQALAQELDARERLALPSSEEEQARVDERPIVSWGESAPLFVIPLAIRIASYVLPPVGLALLWTILQAVHEGRTVMPWFLWGLVVLGIDLGIVFATRRRVRAIAAVAEHTERQLVGILPLFEAAATTPAKTSRLKEIDAALAGAIDATRSLRRRITVFQSRANIFVAVLSPVLLWDLHSASLLEGWRRTHGRAMRAWFDALGELEALASLAGYTAEHPDDVWPELVDGPLACEAESLGHPLLPPDRCVRNDVSLHGPGSVLLVTGSNMSGKSTLLRALGVDVVMALAGLPVRAKRLRVSEVQVATAMRVSDSLQEGESFFLAEVKRLKQVADLAGQARPVLFLLDEILQGTNTRERSLGARGVVAHLSHVGSAGLVSTHDLSLVQLGTSLGDRVRYAHFTDQVDGDQMTFDYRMRPGVVQTSNALRLMRAVGLAVEIPADDAGVTQQQ